jgi:ribose transport system ATP-binding protein
MTPSPAAPTGSFALHAHGIKKSFNGVEVLHGVDLSVTGGRTVALLGENGAGKSTLVKIVAGDYRPDGGSLEIGGVVHAGLNPISARAAGVRMIFQEFVDAPSLSVAENISLGRWPGRHGLVSWAAMRHRANEVLEGLGVDLDPDAPVGGLSVGQRQICEIARALADRARCLVLDEPTAALSSSESGQLFNYLRRLRDQGVAIVYITHRLDEVKEVADDVVVLRNGRTALVADVATASRREIVSAMVGRDVELTVARTTSDSMSANPIGLELRGASSGSAFVSLDLQVRVGEVVALYGKLGSGTSEVADVVFGRRRTDAGTVQVHGAVADFAHPRRAIQAGVAYLPSDRQREGAFLSRPAAENLAAASWRQLRRHRLLTRRRELAAFDRWRRPLRISAASQGRAPIATLSGGNQQKVLVARWLERGSTVLVLVEPTRGVDVGSRQDIYEAIRAQAAAGAAVLVVTSDYEEVVQLADRALVMAKGRLTRELVAPDLTTENLTHAAGG